MGVTATPPTQESGCSGACTSRCSPGVLLRAGLVSGAVALSADMSEWSCTLHPNAASNSERRNRLAGLKILRLKKINHKSCKKSCYININGKAVRIRSAKCTEFKLENGPNGSWRLMPIPQKNATRVFLKVRNVYMTKCSLKT
jgi:hypothetical protein